MEKITRKEQKEQTRQALVKQAESLFSKQGISNTTTAEIAKKLKVSHGTLFVHFPTREDLIKSVVDDFGERLGSSFNENLNFELKLNVLLKAHLKVLSEYEDFYRRLIAESQQLPPHIRSIVFSINASLSYRFYRAAKREMELGNVKQMSQSLFFNTWLGLIHYYVLNRELLSEKSPILGELNEELIRHFLYLIKT